jgi:dTDP-4-amino-4,6-dideoxygalactose transaminase
MQAKVHHYPEGEMTRHLKELLHGTGEIRGDLEKRLAGDFGVAGAFLTTSATAALELALMALDLAPGDEVLLPAYTFVACATAVVRAGGRPVFCDITPDAFCMDPASIESKLTARSRAILAVHYGGVPAEIETLSAFGLPVIEDAAHAFMGKKGDRNLGTLGDFGAFSFHHTKDLSTGEGGLLLVRDAEVYRRTRLCFDKGTNRAAFDAGEVERYTWVSPGSSFAMNDLTAGLLGYQLEEVENLRRRRAEIARRYDEGLAGTNFTLQDRRGEDHLSHHLYPVLVRRGGDRDGLIAHLKQLGIPASFHYVPLHTSPMARTLGIQTELPVTEDVAARLVRLPIHGHMTDDDVDRVIRALVDHQKKRK